jgi:acetoacetate decarboxylase
VSFVKSQEEIEKIRKMEITYYNAENLMIWTLTKEEVIKKVLPPPLKPWVEPLALFLVVNYPRTSFGISYYEGLLAIAAEYKEQPGMYILSVPVTNDMAMASGREIAGYPKKMADIYLNKDGQKATGWIERRGIRFIELQAELTGTVNDEEANSILSTFMGTAPTFFTYIRRPVAKGFSIEESVYLCQFPLTQSIKEIEMGKGEIILKESKADPWIEIEIDTVIGALYTISDNTSEGGTILEEVDPVEFSPYAFRYEFDPE